MPTLTNPEDHKTHRLLVGAPLESGHLKPEQMLPLLSLGTFGDLTSLMQAPQSSSTLPTNSKYHESSYMQLQVCFDTYQLSPFNQKYVEHIISYCPGKEYSQN